MTASGTTASETPVAPPELAATRPLLRGWIHLVAFVVTVIGAPFVIAQAPTAGAAAALAIYMTTIAALFGVSAAFHRIRWAPAARRRMRRADHATIFVAIARLLLKAPDIVVLDEATAHLDSESELAVQLALKTALAGRTSLVIAHRLSTVREADIILVVDEGRIVEHGQHAELLAADGVYAELYRTQFEHQDAEDTGPPRTATPDAAVS